MMFRYSGELKKTFVRQGNNDMFTRVKSKTHAILLYDFNAQSIGLFQVKKQ